MDISHAVGTTRVGGVGTQFFSMGYEYPGRISRGFGPVTEISAE